MLSRITVYSDHGIISITRVGYFKGGSFGPWLAPSDYNARWDDEGRDDDAYNSIQGHHIGVLRQSARDGRWGFAFHEARWSLLLVAVAPNPVSLECLFDLCNSFPCPEHQFSPDWGHHYGGLDRAHPDDSLCVLVDDEYTEHHRLCVTQITNIDHIISPRLKACSLGLRCHSTSACVEGQTLPIHLLCCRKNCS